MKVLYLFGIVMLWLICALLLMRCTFWCLGDCFAASAVEVVSVFAGLLFLVCSLIGYCIMDER